MKVEQLHFRKWMSWLAVFLAGVISLYAAEPKTILVLVTGADKMTNGKPMAAFTDDEERAVQLDKDMPFLLETKLRELGAKIDKRENFVSHAVRDGNLITGQNPASSEATAKLLIEALK